MLRCRGLDVFATAQEKKAAEVGMKVNPNSSMRKLKESVIKSCLIESATVHTLLGFSVVCGSALVSCVRNYRRGELLLSSLAALSVYSRFVGSCILLESSFFTRIACKLSEFEIRRAEADIRTSK